MEYFTTVVISSVSISGRRKDSPAREEEGMGGCRGETPCGVCSTAQRPSFKRRNGMAWYASRSSLLGKGSSTCPGCH